MKGIRTQQRPFQNSTLQMPGGEECHHGNEGLGLGQQKLQCRPRRPGPQDRGNCGPLLPPPAWAPVASGENRALKGRQGSGQPCPWPPAPSARPDCLPLFGKEAPWEKSAMFSHLQLPLGHVGRGLPSVGEAVCSYPSLLSVPEP